MTFPEIEPTGEVRALAANLLERIALNTEGQPFDDANPATWAEADANEPKFFHRGTARFSIVDSDAVELAVAVGAVEPGEAVLCLRVAVEHGVNDEVPSLGHFVVLDASGIPVVFLVAVTYDDLHGGDGPDFGPDALYDERLDALESGQALLVQVFDGAAERETV